MTKQFRSLAVIFCAALSTSAFATTIQVTNGGGVMDNKNEVVSPYIGTLNTTPNITIYCDDLTHTISTADIVVVNVSTIDDLSLTRFGGPAAPTASVAKADYEQIFYLSTFLASANSSPSPYPGPPTPDGQSVQADIQDAMWSYFDPLVQNVGTPQIQYWIAQAAANFSNYNYSSYRILTDAANQYDGEQELFYNTVPDNDLTLSPEPGTIAMLFGGLGALAYGARRRARRVSKTIL